MIESQILALLQKLTKHSYLSLTSRGNAAIAMALAVLPKDKKVLIPNEGGWLGYRTIPNKVGLLFDEVQCTDAVIDLVDLERKLKTNRYEGFIYQNPGGYCAEQPIQEIYELCQKYNCLVILDVSASLGTALCDGRYADYLVCSFGEWKIADAGIGGFISCSREPLWRSIIPENHGLQNDDIQQILEKIQVLSQRIHFLQAKRQQIVKDLANFTILHSQDFGIVVIIAYSNAAERESIINYCHEQKLPWTECPRYIRVNRRAISLEVKRLQHNA